MNIISTTWDKAYSVGHEKIDTEHKKLFEIAAKLFKYKNDSKKILEIIKELISYTKFHFANEEKVMEEIGYDDLERHKLLHKYLIQNLNTTIKEFNNIKIEEVVEKLNQLVNKNIVQHILIEDKKFHHNIKNRDQLRSTFAWKTDYKIKDEIIDKEHKVLFDIAQEALNYQDENPKIHVKKTIQKLYDYMKTHFTHEEDFMEKINYPHIQEHKKLHENIIKQMNQFIKSLSKLTIVEFEKKLIEYIDIWLIGHIIYEDKKIIKFKNSL